MQDTIISSAVSTKLTQSQAIVREKTWSTLTDFSAELSWPAFRVDSALNLCTSPTADISMLAALAAGVSVRSHRNDIAVTVDELLQAPFDSGRILLRNTIKTICGTACRKMRVDPRGKLWNHLMEHAEAAYLGRASRYVPFRGEGDDLRTLGYEAYQMIYGRDVGRVIVKYFRDQRLDSLDQKYEESRYEVAVVDDSVGINELRGVLCNALQNGLQDPRVRNIVRRMAYRGETLGRFAKEVGIPKQTLSRGIMGSFKMELQSTVCEMVGESEVATPHLAKITKAIGACLTEEEFQGLFVKESTIHILPEGADGRASIHEDVA